MNVTMHLENDNAPGQGGTDDKALATTAAFYSAVTLPVENPREHRLLVALTARDLSRESVDRVAGCSNGPALVMRCRERYGLELPCTMMAGVDRDGHDVRFGFYQPTPTDRRRMRQLLALGGVR